MACSKYTLTNTGTTITTFNYRRCDDSMWEEQVELLPNQVKNIWLIDGTYSLSPFYVHNVVLVNNGVFPPIPPTPTPTRTPTQTPTNTPTPSVTATNTPTSTVTPSVTPTNTTTPTPTTTTTPTNTQTNTPTNTTTPSVTPTTTTTPTNTQTNTPTNTTTPTNTPTNTKTPTQTPTNTTTPSVTPTNTPTPTTTPLPPIYAYNYSISQLDLNAATGNTTPVFGVVPNNRVYASTSYDETGNPAHRIFTAAGSSYIHWLCSGNGVTPTFGYYQNDVLITVGLVSTQTQSGLC
jgi:hypothetical protein